MNTNQTINNIMTEKTFKQINLIQSIIVIVTTILLFYCFFGSTVVKTGSMEPTIHVGSPVIYRYAEPTAMDYGDIVLFFYDADRNTEITNNFDVMFNNRVNGLTIYVKRLMGKPGDVMEIIEGYMCRNGERLYEVKEVMEAMEPYIVPENSFYCLGDNRADSYDSAFCGAFSQNVFFGKEVLHLNF